MDQTLLPTKKKERNIVMLDFNKRSAAKNEYLMKYK